MHKPSAHCKRNKPIPGQNLHAQPPSPTTHLRSKLGSLHVTFLIGVCKTCRANEWDKVGCREMMKV